MEKNPIPSWTDFDELNEVGTCIELAVKEVQMATVRLHKIVTFETASLLFFCSLSEIFLSRLLWTVEHWNRKDG